MTRPQFLTTKISVRRLFAWRELLRLVVTRRGRNNVAASHQPVFLTASASMAYNWRLLNSLGCPVTFFRDTTFTAGRVQAAIDAGLRFGPGLILGFAVGTLWPRFRSKRVSLAQIALRLYPRRRAICAALCPTDQSFLSSATSSASQLIGALYADWRPQASRIANCWKQSQRGRVTL